MSGATSPIRRLLPEGLKARNITVSPSGLRVHAEVATASFARCPLCGKRSWKVHSRYMRTIADLPWRNVSVTLKIQARRFFCVNRRCERVIFCERLPEIAPYARKTDRLEEALLLIAFELGGEAGSRLAHELGLLVSPDALLQRLRGAPSPKTDGGVRVLGIDDWALRKGRRYGTILVDLEKHKVVDLLPDRTAETLEEWLKGHPGIEVVSRDRYQPYIDAINKGAPKALQVADRWHLTKNLTDTLERVLERERISLEQALKLTLPEEPPYLPPLMVAYVKFCWKYERLTPEEMWEEISRTRLGRYREAFGYVVGRLRKGLPPTRRTREETLKAKAEAKRRAPRALARLFARDPQKLSAADREYLSELWEWNSELERAYELAQGFCRMLRGRDPEMLDGWLQEASNNASPELQGFAESLRGDYEAVRAALCV